MRSRLPHKKDDNHAELTRVFEAAGCTVLDLSMVGGDCPDVLVGIHGVNVLVEFKNPKARGKLTQGQQRFIAEWKGPAVSCDSVDSALAIVRQYRDFG